PTAPVLCTCCVATPVWQRATGAPPVQETEDTHPWAHVRRRGDRWRTGRTGGGLLPAPGRGRPRHRGRQRTARWLLVPLLGLPATVLTGRPQHASRLVDAEGTGPGVPRRTARDPLPGRLPGTLLPPPAPPGAGEGRGTGRRRAARAHRPGTPASPTRDQRDRELAWPTQPPPARKGPLPGATDAHRRLPEPARIRRAARGRGRWWKLR